MITLFFRLFCLVSALFLVVPVDAQTDVIGQRKALMKAVGGATRDPGQMLRGQQPFDLAKVKASLDAYADSAAKMSALYPAGSETGGETQASPMIWQNKADFEARLAKFGIDAKTALAAITDEASFKTEFPTVMKNCGGCHETYRAEKK
jgi:cytochrome c556